MENIKNLDSIRDINNDNQLIDRMGQNLFHLRKDSANHIVHLIRYSMSDASYTHHGHMHPSYSTPLHIRFT